MSRAVERSWRGLSALFLPLLLVPGCAPLPAEAPSRPSGACAWQVCVRSYDSATGRIYEVVNGEPVPVTVRLSFRSLQNLRPETDVPVERVVPPNASAQLVRLETLRPGRRIDARPTVNIDLGASVTRPDQGYLYAVPFGGSAPRQIIQGFDGSDTHRLGMRYSLDIAMPEGTPILAAREGVVLYVQDGFTAGGRDPDLLERANLVVVAHSDGSMASYGHLSPGLTVARGDQVEEGQLLGYSGATGFAGEPHLHFHVGVRLLADPGRTVPFRLRGPDGEPLDLEEGSVIDPAPSAP
jgi:murein DD-endopeptidase MepM/ murein hydrolase activator NlpD